MLSLWSTVTSLITAVRAVSLSAAQSNNSIGKGNRPLRIVNIADLFTSEVHNVLVVTELHNQNSYDYIPEESIQILNSRTRTENFGVVTRQCHGNMFFTFKVTGRRMYHAIYNVCYVRSQSRSDIN